MPIVAYSFVLYFKPIHRILISNKLSLEYSLVITLQHCLRQGKDLVQVSHPPLCKIPKISNNNSLSSKLYCTCLSQLQPPPSLSYLRRHIPVNNILVGSVKSDCPQVNDVALHDDDGLDCIQYYCETCKIAWSKQCTLIINISTQTVTSPSHCIKNR